MTQTTAGPAAVPGLPSAGPLMRALRRHHTSCLTVFAVIVVAHWAEHLVQAFQIYALGWPTSEALGVVGLWFPWLIRAEVLHYAYAIVMLVMLWLLRDGFTGAARQWWMLAFGLQFWHHIEHLLLLLQATFGFTLGGGPVPMSLLQFFVPRVELHLFYNTIVTAPMIVAMVLHLRARSRAGR
ncbi:hypothetical protein [Cellulomonas sp. NPDC058312]|jgi:hypothetical protein|uniref:hypothetical protein n=1 Tax=Cellulomonas sp. NPDC058312 TaxID=3346441 RepID=UPI0036E9A516